MVTFEPETPSDMLQYATRPDEQSLRSSPSASFRRFLRLTEVAAATCLDTRTPFEVQIQPGEGDAIYLRGYESIDDADDHRTPDAKRFIHIEVGSVAGVMANARMGDAHSGVDDFTVDYGPLGILWPALTQESQPSTLFFTAFGSIALPDLDLVSELETAFAITRLFPKATLTRNGYTATIKCAMADAVEEDPEALRRLSELLDEVQKVGLSLNSLGDCVASFVIHPGATFEDSYCGNLEAAVNAPEFIRLLHRKLAALEPRVDVVLAGNPLIPDDLAQDLAKSEYQEEEHGTAQRLAECTHNPKLLAQLSLSNNRSVRFSVAENANTLPLTLHRLAADPDISDIRFYCADSDGDSIADFLTMFAVLRNHNCDDTILEQFACGSMTWTLNDFEAAHGWRMFDEVDEAKVQSQLRDEAAKILSERRLSN